MPGDTNGRRTFSGGCAIASFEQPSAYNLRNGGAQAIDRTSFGPSINADGEFILFSSGASNLVANDTNDESMSSCTTG